MSRTGAGAIGTAITAHRSDHGPLSAHGSLHSLRRRGGGRPYFLRRRIAVTRPTVDDEDESPLQFDSSAVQVADIEVPASAWAASVASAAVRFDDVTELQLGVPPPPAWRWRGRRWCTS